jgi:hypothetical protein
MLFELVSGLKVNFHKSMLYWVNVASSWLHEAASVLHCKHDRLSFLYLGLPIGSDPRKLAFWYLLVDRIKRRLSDWKSCNLSMGGRLILLKSVLSSIPVYFLSFFKTPSGIISTLESLFNAFCWEGCEDIRKITWIKWETVCLRKEEGVLGVRRLREFNLALLGKWWWMILQERGTLWYRVLCAHYGEEGGRLCCSRRSGGSVWWQTILDVRDGVGRIDSGWMLDNITRRVGDGLSTLFWVDPWL